MPFASSWSAMKAASTTNGAPGSPCAGPKTAPGKECAIMTWSRTSTANKEQPPQGSSGLVCCRIGDELAQHAALRSQDGGEPRRQVVKRDGGSDQCIEPRIGEQVHRRRESTVRRPAGVVRGRDAADLAGDEF